MELEIKTIKGGDKGELVGVWQAFLRGKGLYRTTIDNDFGPSTAEATMAYEASHGLLEDAIVDDFLWDIAVSEGLAKSAVRPYLFPEEPDFSPLSFHQRQELFGEIKYKHVPVKNKPERVVITNDWDEDHLESAVIPQFVKAREKHGWKMGWPKEGRVQVHKKAKENFLGFFEYVEEAGFLDRLISFGGLWSARLTRGGSSLSNHAHAVAFDINVPWNWMGNECAPIGQKGSLIELVPLANAWGFYWGGHFRRIDGMHFELTKPDMKPKHDAKFYTELFMHRT